MKEKKIAFDEKLPMTLHLGEIRWRLIRVIIFLSLLFTICFCLSETILDIIRIPIEGQSLIFITATEVFFVHLKIAFFAALTLCIPYILYHAWAFIAPGLLENEKKNTLPFVLFSSIFFAIGIIFAYYLVLPFGLKFLLTYKASTLTADITVSNYVSFAFRLLLVFGIIFEFPLIVLFLAKIGVLKPIVLKKSRKYAILIIFIASAILTPPNVVHQILMAIPLMLLYEISIILCSMVYKKRQPQKEGVAGA